VDGPKKLQQLDLNGASARLSRLESSERNVKKNFLRPVSDSPMFIKSHLTTTISSRRVNRAPRSHAGSGENEKTSERKGANAKAPP